MRAAIYSHQHLIGYADLQLGDVAMGGVYGELSPTALYYRQVQKTVWECNASPTPDYSKWLGLALSAQLENGYFLFPAGGYEIDDITELPQEPKRIYITGIAAEILQDFIEADPPRTFVEEPWQTLTIRQKLALETELSCELGRNAGRISGAAITNSPVVKTSFSALCSTGTNNVLFSIQGAPAEGSHFALVHLTWSGVREKKCVFTPHGFLQLFC